MIAEAAARRTPLAVAGGATKEAVGRPAQTEATLSSAALTGVTLYEPAELVIAARAGTPLSEIVATLAGRGQQLPFEPMDHRVLLGSTGAPTIGAVAAANVSGPRRIMAGAARDSLIGVRFVNGQGEAVTSGGRVMKNVTGLDLVKLMAGSWGTLGFLTEVTFKVLPRPERVATLALSGLDDARAIAALCAAVASPFEVTGAAHLPAALDGAGGRTLLRIEGFSLSVDHRLDALRRLLKGFGAVDVVEGEAADALWRAVRDVAPLAEPRERACGASRRRRPRGRPSPRRWRAPATHAGSTIGAAASCGSRRTRPTTPARRPCVLRYVPRAATRRWCARRRSCAPRWKCSSP